MGRLLWAGAGAIGAVVAAERARRTLHRYTPEGVTEQVEAAQVRAWEALREALDTFRVARAERERDLVAQLLVTPEDGDPQAARDLLRGRGRGSRTGRHADDDAHLAWDADPAWDVADPSRRRAPSSARPSGRVDADEPLLDF